MPSANPRSLIPILFRFAVHTNIVSTAYNNNTVIFLIRMSSHDKSLHSKSESFSLTRHFQVIFFFLVFFYLFNAKVFRRKDFPFYCWVCIWHIQNHFIITRFSHHKWQMSCSERRNATKIVSGIWQNGVNASIRITYAVLRNKKVAIHLKCKYYASFGFIAFKLCVEFSLNNTLSSVAVQSFFSHSSKRLPSNRFGVSTNVKYDSWQI